MVLKYFLFFYFISRLRPISSPSGKCYRRPGRGGGCCQAVDFIGFVDILFVSDHGLLGFATRLCRGRTSTCQGALHGYVGGATRLCRRRDTVMSEARIGYVGGVHRLCRGRASVMCAARIYASRPSALLS